MRYINFKDSSCYSIDTPFYLINVESGKYWADGVVYIQYNTNISGQDVGIPIYFEKVLTNGVWDETTVIIRNYNVNGVWDKPKIHGSDPTALNSDDKNRTNPTFKIVDNGDDTFKIKINDRTDYVGFQTSGGNIVNPVRINRTNNGSDFINWAIVDGKYSRYVVGRKYSDDYITLDDPRCFDPDNPVYIYNVNHNLWASTSGSGLYARATGLPVYFEKVLVDGVWDNNKMKMYIYYNNTWREVGYSADSANAATISKTGSTHRFILNGDGITYSWRISGNSNVGFFSGDKSIRNNAGATSGTTVWAITSTQNITLRTFIASNATNSKLIKVAISENWIDRMDGLWADEVVLPEYTGASDTSIFKTCGVTSFNELQYCTEVTSIPNYCFYNCTALTSIILPTSVTTIGTSAFAASTSLSTFDTKNVEIIGTDAFRSCYGLTTLTLGAACTTINGATFLNCSNLSRVNCSSISSWLNITFASIYSTPLYHNAHLYINNVEQTQITIPSNITTIKQHAFYNGRYFQKIIIPETVTTIKVYAFQNCNLLKTAGPIGSGCDIEFGWTTRMPSYAFHSANYLETVIIPSTFTTIRDRSFAYCSSLKYIDLPESCTTIEVEGLKGCTSLECMVIRAGNINIQPSALTGDTNLRRVYFSNSTSPKSTSTFVDIASGEAFVWVPEGSKSAYETFFDGKGYTVKEGRDFSLPLEIIDPVNTELLNIAKSYDWVPNEATYLTTLDCSQVNDSRLAAPGPSGYEDLETFPELKYFLGITTIPANLFSDSSFSGDIIVPDNVIEIGTGAFHGCGTNSKVIINNAYINSDAFSESNPKEIYLGDGVEISSDGNPFTYCPDTKYYVSEDNLTIAHTHDHTGITDITGGALVTLNKSLLIPNKTVFIGPGALVQNIGNSGQLILPKYIESIDDSALEQQTYNKVFAKSLRTLEVGELNTTIGTLYVPEGKIDEYTDAWADVYSIGEIKEFKTQKVFPLTRRDTKSKQIEWTDKYTRVTSVMRWGGSQEGDIDIELPINKVGGFNVYSMNSKSWGTYNGNYLIGARKDNKNYLEISYQGNYTNLHRMSWNNVLLTGSSGDYDGSTPSRRTLTVIDSTGKVHYDYNYNNGTITSNISSGLQTSDAGIRFLCQGYMGNNYHYLGYKIYDAEFYGRNDDGTCSNVLISKLIPVLRKSDNKPGLYDLIRHKFFTKSESGNLGWERAIVPNDGIQYNVTNAPSCDCVNGTDTEKRWRYGGHGIGKTVYESNWSGNDGSDGKQCAFWYLAAPGKITFHNTFTNRCDLLLENDYGRRVYAFGCAANATTELNVNEKLWKDANYLSIVFWDKPVLANLVASNWYFTYSDLEVKYEDLPQGYTRIEYIEKTEGTAWIDTGRAGTSGNLFELEFGLIVENGAFKDFMVGSIGSTPNNNRNLFTMGTYNGPQKRNSYNNPVPQSILPITEDKHTLIMDTRNSTFTCSIDGNDINVTVPSGTIDGNGGNIQIFRSNNNGSTAKYGRIYRFKVGVTADIKPSRDFVPCINDQNEVGLFDLVYRTFYGSQTSDTFTAGPIVSSSGNN